MISASAFFPDSLPNGKIKRSNGLSHADGAKARKLTPEQSPSSAFDPKILDKLTRLVSFLNSLDKQGYQRELRELVGHCKQCGPTYLLKLSKLDLSYCDLTEIPEEFAELTQLKELRLNGNKLKTLPCAFSALQNLRELNLSSNQFEQLPKAAFKMVSDNQKKQKYIRLQLHDNPIRNLPQNYKHFFSTYPDGCEFSQSK